MLQTSPLSTTIFLILMVIVCCAMAWVFRAAGFRWATVVGGILGWATFTGALPFVMVNMPPTAQTFAFMPVLLVPFVIVATKPGRLVAATVPLAILAGIQVLRLPLELVLEAWWTQGVVPIQMTFHDDNLDIITGILALPAAFLIWRGWAAPWVAWVFNVMGIAFLVRIISIVMLSSPTPIRAIFGGYDTEPDVLLGLSFPHIWIGTIAVFYALVLHYISIRALLSRPKINQMVE